MTLFTSDDKEFILSVSKVFAEAIANAMQTSTDNMLKIVTLQQKVEHNHEDVVEHTDCLKHHQKILLGNGEDGMITKIDRVSRDVSVIKWVGAIAVSGLIAEVVASFF